MAVGVFIEMRPSSKKPRILAAVAAVILLATLVFHASGYTDLADEVGRSQLSSFFRRALPGSWLYFSWHLIAVAFALGWASWRGSGSARPLLIFLSVLVCADTLFVFYIAGIFAGTLLLAGVALLCVIAAIQWPAA